jgi:hypothetical protein
MIWISFFPLLKLLFAILIQGILVHTVVTDTDTFDYTGNVQTWIVPFNVHSIHLVVKGASGGVGTTAAVTGKGATVECDLTVTSGTQIKIYVGGKGADAHASNSHVLNGGGWNGGGKGYGSGTGGGGASDIRIGGTGLDDRKVVAGGGGGTYAWRGCPGGASELSYGGNGGLIGSAGKNGCFSSVGGSVSGGYKKGGSGGTGSAGGAAGDGTGTDGSKGDGGNGEMDNNDFDSGGGGGGYWGG